MGQPVANREQVSAHASDPRILGDSEFVTTLLQQLGSLGQRIKTSLPLSIIADLVADRLNVPVRVLAGTSRASVVVNARAVTCHLSILAGYTAAEVGRFLDMSRYGASTAAARGKKMVDENGEYTSLVDIVDESAG